MRGFHARRSVAVCLGAALCLLLFSSEGAAGRLHGKVKKRIYHSPEKTFSVPVPKGTFTARKVSDHYEAKGRGFVGSVSFHDEMGDLEGILYIKRPAGFEPSESNWRLWLHEVALPGWFKQASPESRILVEEPFTFEGMDAYRALVELPGGSPAMDMVSGRRFDSRRGLVLFERGCCLWVLMTETLTSPVWNQEEPEPVAENWADFTPSLESFYETIDFGEPAEQVAKAKPDLPSARLEGKLKKGVYVSPGKNFSVEVPQGTRARDGYTKDSRESFVEFVDGAGSFKGIWCTPFHRSERMEEVLADAERAKRAFTNYFRDVILPWIFYPVSPESSVLSSSVLSYDRSPAYYFLVDVPEASGHWDTSTKEKWDVRRATLLFNRCGYTYIVVHELVALPGGAEGVSGGIENPESLTQEMADGERALRQFIATIRFSGCA